MGTISIERTESFEASADRLWQILADEFTNVASWASSIDHSKANADAMNHIDGAPAGGRVCEIPGFGVTDERFIRFDAENKSFAYSVKAGKMPGFVRDFQSAWSVEAIGPHQARVTFTVSANTAGILGALMGPMMKKRFAGSAKTIMGDLKIYAETGHPSTASS
jgi:hypothetical protein